MSLSCMPRKIMTTNIQILRDENLSVYPEFDQHRRVVRFEDSTSGLVGFIAIHRERGPLSTGGTRYVSYPNEADAIRDALRLSRAMTAKCVVSGLPYGGAKGVIMARQGGIQKSKELLAAYAGVVESLGGAFRTGEDVGMTEQDVQILLSHSNFFNGKSDIAGDPSPFAAESVALVMDRISQLHLGVSPEKLRIAVKGIGKVGGALVKILAAQGANVSIADVNKDALEQVRGLYPAIAEISPEEIAFTDSDIYAPCALGNEVNEGTIDRFQAKMLCGGANNQLADPRFAKILESHNILYVPDYLANAGGLINVSDELEPDGYHRNRVTERINAIGTLAEKLYLSSRNNTRTFLEEVEEYVRANV